jgi:hypothetical protein
VLEISIAGGIDGGGEERKMAQKKKMTEVEQRRQDLQELLGRAVTLRDTAVANRQSYTERLSLTKARFQEFLTSPRRIPIFAAIATGGLALLLILLSRSRRRNRRK